MLVKASVTDLENILTSWTSVTEEYGDEGIVFASDLSSKIESLKKEISNPNSFAYVFKDENSETKAFLDIIHALPNSNVSWLKMLDLNLHPELALGDIDIEEAGRTLFHSIFEPINLLFTEHKEAKELKIYGRNDALHRLFSYIAKDEELKTQLGETDILCLRNGSWLVFRKK